MQHYHIHLVQLLLRQSNTDQANSNIFYKWIHHYCLGTLLADMLVADYSHQHTCTLSHKLDNRLPLVFWVAFLRNKILGV